MNILVIDTSDSSNIKVGLRVNNQEYKINQKMKRAQVVLRLIDKLLTKHKLSIYDLNKIKVNTGPGSFTGLRVSISIANALGFFLKIPINGKKVGELAHPKYK
ncbi:MAG: hypothetical protein A3B44_02955 [Candidatus Levybacteria bacterium RIFCSPLOWO2_01_FULL_38_21]|nr:MAG: hypothetical protein A3B44_02955 [Candidatus Levybacteria bacterium RIFCSPLOWO2_01_FULL_38_21]